MGDPALEIISPEQHLELRRQIDTIRYADSLESSGVRAAFFQVLSFFVPNILLKNQRDPIGLQAQIDGDTRKIIQISSTIAETTPGGNSLKIFLNPPRNYNPEFNIMFSRTTNAQEFDFSLFFDRGSGKFTRALVRSGAEETNVEIGDSGKVTVLKGSCEADAPIRNLSSLVAVMIDERTLNEPLRMEEFLHKGK